MVIAKIVRGLFYLNLRFETVENAQKKSWNAGNSFTVFADEMDVQVQQETTEMKKKFLQQKRQEACRWLSANKGDEYWFEARAYIK